MVYRWWLQIMETETIVYTGISLPRSQATGRRSQSSLLAICGAEGAELNRGLCLHDLGWSVDRQIHALRLLLLKLLLDPEVSDPQPVLQAKLGSVQWMIRLCRCEFRDLKWWYVWNLVEYLQPHSRSPAKLLLNECVVWVAPTHTLRPGNVVDGQLLVLKAQDYFSHLVHADHFVTSNVYRLTEIRLC